jgi:hypothetical protein
MERAVGRRLGNGILQGFDESFQHIGVSFFLSVGNKKIVPQEASFGNKVMEILNKP